ncbi:MAG: OsmC family protein [Candidatus Natronoplasma sp.]
MAEAKMATFETEVDKKEGMECEVKMRDFSLTIDEPKNLGGTNKGPNPVEVLLGSLGGCLSITGEVVAKEMDLDLENFNLKIEGDLDPRGFQGTADVPAGFQDIRVKIDEIEGVPEKKMDEFVEKIQKRCPIEDTLKRKLEVQIER